MLPGNNVYQYCYMGDDDIIEGFAKSRRDAKQQVRLILGPRYDGQHMNIIFVGSGGTI